MDLVLSTGTCRPFLNVSSKRWWLVNQKIGEDRRKTKPCYFTLVVRRILLFIIVRFSFISVNKYFIPLASQKIEKEQRPLPLWTKRVAQRYTEREESPPKSMTRPNSTFSHISFPLFEKGIYTTKSVNCHLSRFLRKSSAFL